MKTYERLPMNIKIHTKTLHSARTTKSLKQNLLLDLRKYEEALIVVMPTHEQQKS